ncbi:MAG: tripartite tricarboxylate transporter substrate binding protein [Polaromonas sp.]|uniref:Bug family tripartite tricarboxylate transporter substrate binding protein n=1 Tax=Polaromonas sp. TaxID=1869339 RepID=UPI0025EB8A67|nr:tripartite tricarboxylate transporter substrate binding protein [Polaromonas sp.]MBI2728423.1 tripartite tricarboxylate transporter substrate binding protein [Polaromonas sp.]
MNLIKRALSTGLLMAFVVAAQAQTWPGQTIRIVVPFTPGTGMDTIARAVSPKLSERLGQPVIVQNTPGASGNIGADAVAKATPDGYTVLMGANTMLIASQLYQNVPFNPVKDFSSVSMAAYGTLMLVSNPKTNIKSLKDLMALAKSKPGFISYGSPGVGTPHHMAMELLKSEGKVSMLHIPYKGTAGYVQDLLGGELMVGFLPVHVAQGFVTAGKLNALAVGSAKRNPAAPNVATLQELGMKGLNVDMWYGFFVPNRTPANVVSRLNTEIAAIMKLPDVQSVLTKGGLDASSSTPAELTTIVGQDYTRWGKVIKTNGIAAE